MLLVLLVICDTVSAGKRRQRALPTAIARIITMASHDVSLCRPPWPKSSSVGCGCVEDDAAHLENFRPHLRSTALARWFHASVRTVHCPIARAPNPSSTASIDCISRRRMVIVRSSSGRRQSGRHAKMAAGIEVSMPQQGSAAQRPWKPEGSVLGLARGQVAFPQCSTTPHAQWPVHHGTHRQTGCRSFSFVRVRLLRRRLARRDACVGLTRSSALLRTTSPSLRAASQTGVVCVMLCSRYKRQTTHQN